MTDRAFLQRKYASGASAYRPPHLIEIAGEPTMVWRQETASKTPATVRVRLAAGRALYAALGHAGATSDAPFTIAKPARDTTAPWDKRAPYTAAEAEALSRAADAEERVLVL